ncbi:MAG TPA: hypothetical protein VFR52_08885, partial [Sphingomicrobium sp.]|nr:hypothetical protein [Sphingomicrobium sp.]
MTEGPKVKDSDSDGEAGELANAVARRQTDPMADLPTSATSDPEEIRATIEGTQLKALPVGADRMAAILDLINGAKQSLHLIFYIFAADEAG